MEKEVMVIDITDETLESVEACGCAGGAGFSLYYTLQIRKSRKAIISKY